MLALLLSLTPARAELPLPEHPECGVPDEPQLCPDELGDDWTLLGHVPAHARASVREAELALGSGIAADQAWALHTGRFDTLIAIADSGIEWTSTDLIDKVHLNLGELPPPLGPEGEVVAGYDVDGNGVVNVSDYRWDPRVSPADGVDEADGLLDPSDLIAAFSDGWDDDGNGYTDDIAGWDFFDGDNDAWSSLRTSYGTHGTGVFRDAAAEGDNGGRVGVCPNCAILPIRVGDTFVTDGTRVGKAIVFAADSGADVLGMALGGLTHPEGTTRAMDYATARGMLIVAAAADENSYHHNMPSTRGDALSVHSVRTDTADADDAVYSYMNFFNCNNYGPRIDMVAGSEGCATGSVALISGAAGLTRSAAREAGVELDALELRALLVGSVDDVWLSPEELEQAGTYPSDEGYDPFYGYGRANVARAVEQAMAGEVPPVARFEAPQWFDTFDPARTPAVDLRFSLGTRSGEPLDWRLDWGQGWHPVAWTPLDEGRAGDGAQVDLSMDLSGVPTAPLPPPEEDEGVLGRVERVHAPAVTLRLTVTDAAGRSSEARRTFFVYEDPDLLPGFPMALGGSIEASPILVDLDGDGVLEILVAGSGGELRALDGQGALRPGWPVTTFLSEEMDFIGGSAAYTSGAVPPWREGLLATPAAGDIDGDGRPEVVAAGQEGRVYAWRRDGALLPGFPVAMRDRSAGRFGPEDSWDIGAAGAPTLADLDGDGVLDVLVAGLDGRVYAWDGQGTPLAPYPLELCHPENCGARRSRIITSPTVDDLDGDGDPDVILGGAETTRGGSRSVTHAFDARSGAPLPGWPKEEGGLVAYAALLPIIGEGHPASVAVAELDGDEGLEVMDPVMLGQVPLRHHDAEVLHALNYNADGFGPQTSSNEPAFLALANNPAFGDVDMDGVPDVFVGGAGTWAVVSLALTTAVDFQHAIGGWSGATGEMLPGWPRQVEDFSFLMSPAIADLSGDGRPEVIYGSGGYVLHAWDAEGAQPPGWPRFTGHWILGSPAVGDVDGDGYVDVVVATREGWLFAWRSKGRADQDIQWASVHHDPQNTGSHRTPLAAQAGPPAEEAPPCGCVAGGGGPAWWALPGLVVLLARRRRGSPGQRSPSARAGA